MKTTLKVIVLITAIILTTGRAIQGIFEISEGTDGLWDVLIVIVWIALFFFLALCINVSETNTDQKTDKP